MLSCTRVAKESFNFNPHEVIRTQAGKPSLLILKVMGFSLSVNHENLQHL